ncbi:MAG: hypothetical protein JOZ69_00385, partial [Myxococcales bacterium]|nr:hypothetical protein [Myxococcales bacterium]
MKRSALAAATLIAPLGCAPQASPAAEPTPSDSDAAAGVGPADTGRTGDLVTGARMEAGAAGPAAAAEAAAPTPVDAAAPACQGAGCASACAGHLTLCGGSCVDTTGNSQNCGACGHACAATQSCYSGACICPAGEGPCGANGQCVDILSSVNSCGGCMPCASGASCSGGVCACPAGGAVCAGACVDTNDDPKNCGNCGATCTVTGTQCLYGGCIDPSSVDCGAAAMTGNSCTASAAVLMGKYWVNNNQWGVASGATSGQQCVWGTCQTGDLVGWGTSWNWTAGTGGVKTYASIVFGWQYGFKVANTGLPVQIAGNKAISCGWDFTVSQTGTLDVSFDTWLHTIASPGANSTPSEEVMIWLYR